MSMTHVAPLALALALVACAGETGDGGFVVLSPQSPSTTIIVNPASSAGPLPSSQVTQAPAEEGSVVLRNVASGRCLDVPRQAQESRTMLWTWDCNKTPAQKWVLSRAGDGYVLSSTVSGKCLDVPYASKGSNITLWQYDCNNTPAQLWALERNDAGGYLVRSRASGLCLDVPHGQPSNGIGVQQYPCHGGAAQRWELSRQL